MKKLPLACEAYYHSNFLTETEANQIYDSLMNDHDLTTHVPVFEVNGVKIVSNYAKLMLLEPDLFESNALPEEIWGAQMSWPEELLELKSKIEQLAGRSFQVGVCIYYPDGNSGVDFHSDLIAYGDTSVIPSLSLGEEREFILREKSSGEEYKVLLEHGSLLVMGEGTQELYEHGLPENTKYKNGRINITFRAYGFKD